MITMSRVRMEPTHQSRGATWRYLCTPIASHLNHDGKANGITRVVRQDGTVVDVGTSTLRPVQFTVRQFDNTRWHSNGIAGDTVYRKLSDAQRARDRFERNQYPGQSVTIITELVEPLVKATYEGKTHLAASPSGIAFPRCLHSRKRATTRWFFVRHVTAEVTCERCRRLGGSNG